MMQSANQSDAVMRAVGISKTYGTTTVLHDVNFSVRPGEVHALVGENGAGKTTLLKIMCGREQPTAGHLEVDGASYDGLTPALARKLGVNVVPQHLDLVNDLSIADNLFLNRWPTRGLRIDQKTVVVESQRILQRVGVSLDPRTLVRDLSYVEKQMVEIARISEFQPRLIILDEPTAALSIREIAILFGMIQQLRAAGIAIAYVSHYLNEISQISDCITVLRDGRVVTSGPTGNYPTSDIIRHMTGDISDLYTGRSVAPGAAVLGIQHAQTDVVRDLSLELRAGEVVGLAAPKGEGLSDFLRALCGVKGRLRAGSVTLRGRPVHIRNSAQALRHGIAYLSEERSRWGVIKGRSVGENLSLVNLPRLSTRAGVLRFKMEREKIAELIRTFFVRTPSVEADIRVLSGGNQQKALMARILSARLPVYVLDDPTFGVDVRSKSEINKLISCEVQGGAAVLLATSDMDEMLNMCDRILIVKEGRVAHEFERGALTLADLEQHVAA